MAATTDVSICSQALLLLGADPIQSFEDGTDEANAAAELYPTVKAMVLSKGKWRFTITKKRLSRLSTAPLTKWQYQYQLPSARLVDGPIKVFDSDADNARPITHYEIAGVVLYSDEEAIYVDYQTAVDESGWPPYFIHLMVIAMAAHLAGPVTESDSTGKRYWDMAFGTPQERGMGGLLGDALTQNAQESPPSSIPSDEFILVRSQ